MENKKKYTYIDLFAGAGGLTIGFGNKGFHLEMANDIAEPALNTLKRNLIKTHPDTDQDRVILGDIKELYEHLGNGDVIYDMQGHMVVETNKEVELRKKAPSVRGNDTIKDILSGIKHVDVLAGGPPCQGFSMIGRSKKASLEERTKGFIDDPRNQLFKYYLKFAEKLSPKLVLIENVKGLASASGYRDLIEKSLTDTGEYGYDTSSHILNAKDFGLAQNRERIFFIGVRKDLSEKYEINASEIFDEIIKGKKDPLKLKEVIYDLPQIKANPKPNNYKEEAEVSFENRDSCFGKNISDVPYKKLINQSANKKYLKAINTYNGKLKTPKFLFNHKARYHNDRDLFIYKNLVAGKYLNDPVNEKALSKVTYGVVIDEDGNKKVKGFGDKYFKLDSESVSKTIIAHLETDGNSYVHPGEFPRSITPREAARIQSFPDWYFFTGNTRNQLKQIGNAVPPMLGGVFAEQFKNVLDLITENEK
ncbi:DNA cytosine methyltransferase [Algibacter amylolyticus]|uniref:Cytosine-specific methyltransferase n=1 Tax=Algibacter amylolyticus TaxID=1608400 RepID=A0A5M7BFJ9_9FLAO|nr:DNA cytosine methyltransferase [Algibacter amylolyticus]KAA5827743.1 DNA cytosine methyltransferase [Algibacter amylolyticus]MBB5266966.1 DNA (cytosine-5)-methyltransferase 1 [Algibacter amylolyticus]TSJ81988.1 DNA cytosine methyltransferase [Algibacter amylolyticus]